MIYIITKEVKQFTYYLQQTSGKEVRWNGLKDNAKTFTEERLAESFCLIHKIRDGEIKQFKS